MAAYTNSNAAACSGGNHVSFDATLGPLSGKVHMMRDELMRTPTREELAEFARLYARIKVAQLSNPTPVQVRNAINSISVTI